VKKGDIVLIPFPFTDLTGNKLRPAVILICTKLDVTVCFITTQLQWKDKYDVELIASSLNGLKKDSIVRVGKLATIDKDLVLGKIGDLEPKYLLSLNNSLTILLQLK
jgi:mRNA interferase MazF